jgi:hypothetical protein
MISLPLPATHTWLKSFWLVMSIAGGILIASISSQLLSPLWFMLVIGGALVLAAPGLWRPQIASLPYRAWNKLGRIFARSARGWLLLICYYLIFVAVGRTGSSLRLSRPAPTESQWLPRNTYTPSADDVSRGITMEMALRRRWAGSLLVWATTTRNWWVCCLLPFLLLYAALDSEREEQVFPVGIYTLF